MRLVQESVWPELKAGMSLRQGRGWGHGNRQWGERLSLRRASGSGGELDRTSGGKNADQWSQSGGSSGDSRCGFHGKSSGLGQRWFSS